MALSNKIHPIVESTESQPKTLSEVVNMKRGFAQFQTESESVATSKTSFSSERREMRAAVNDAVSHRISKEFYRNIFLISVPLVALVIFSSVTLYRTVESFLLAEDTLQVVSDNSKMADLVVALQTESSLSGYAIRRIPSIELFAAPKLEPARKETDAAFEQAFGIQFDPFVVNNSIVATLRDVFRLVQDHRRDEEDGDVAAIESIQFYTEITTGLRRTGILRSTEASSGGVWPLLVANDHLLRVVNFYGITLSIGLLYYASCQLRPENLLWFRRSQSRGGYFLDGAFVYYEVIPEVFDYYLNAFDVDQDLIEDEIDIILENKNYCELYGFDATSQQGVYWFYNLTRLIDAVLATRQDISEIVNNRSSQVSVVSKWTTSVCIIGLVGTAVLCIICVTFFARESYQSVVQIGRFNKLNICNGACISSSDHCQYGIAYSGLNRYRGRVSP